ncbi:MAG: hypothetical protein ACKPJD_24380, partial [Planctomycetaceae bacterium]
NLCEPVGGEGGECSFCGAKRDYLTAHSPLSSIPALPAGLSVCRLFSGGRNLIMAVAPGRS